MSYILFQTDSFPWVTLTNTHKTLPWPSCKRLNILLWMFDIPESNPKKIYIPSVKISGTNFLELDNECSEKPRANIKIWIHTDQQWGQSNRLAPKNVLLEVHPTFVYARKASVKIIKTKQIKAYLFQKYIYNIYIQT